MLSDATAMKVPSGIPSDFGWEVRVRDVGADATETVTDFSVPIPEIRCEAAEEYTLRQLWPDNRPREDEADIWALLKQETRRVLDEIEVGLLEDREEALRYGDSFATEPAVVACKRVASQIISWLVATPLGMKWAAFGEATGSVSLVLSSDVTDRRVDFRISPDGQHISAIRIDEHLTAKTVPLSLDDTTSLRESAEWVCSGA